LSNVSGTVPANDDPRNSASYRAAKALVIILAVFIALALIALVVGFVWRLTGHSPASQAESANPEMYQLRTGAKITDMKVDSGHVILRIKTDQGEEIEIVDDASGRVVSRIVAPK
jgi:flagellar basal body-associated protein FliL